MKNGIWKNENEKSHCSLGKKVLIFFQSSIFCSFKRWLNMNLEDFLCGFYEWTIETVQCKRRVCFTFWVLFASVSHFIFLLVLCGAVSLGVGISQHSFSDLLLEEYYCVPSFVQYLEEKQLAIDLTQSRHQDASCILWHVCIALA